MARRRVELRQPQGAEWVAETVGPTPPRRQRSRRCPAHSPLSGPSRCPADGSDGADRRRLRRSPSESHRDHQGRDDQCANPSPAPRRDGEPRSAIVALAKSVTVPRTQPARGNRATAVGRSRATFEPDDNEVPHSIGMIGITRCAMADISSPPYFRRKDRRNHHRDDLTDYPCGYHDEPSEAHVADRALSTQRLFTPSVQTRTANEK